MLSAASVVSLASDLNEMIDFIAGLKFGFEVGGPFVLPATVVVVAGKADVGGEDGQEAGEEGPDLGEGEKEEVHVSGPGRS